MSSFAVILTDKCNFDCAYCYEPRGKQDLDFLTLVRALDFLSPYFKPGCFINFYGGEPLLTFDTLRRTVDYLQSLSQKHNLEVRYSLTTNGSLLNDDVLAFLDENRFFLALSFDGLAQDLQRKEGTFDFLSSAIPRILARPGISLETNSVFSSETVCFLNESIQLLIRLGVPKLDVNFAHKPAWMASSLRRLKKEMMRLAEYFMSRYEKLSEIPWPSFYGETEKTIYRCQAGQDRLALSAQGTLWGCAIFPHYFAWKSRTNEGGPYCFGDVNTFLKDACEIYPQKMLHYYGLSMDRFSTPDRACLKCDEIEQCWVCPVAAALTSGEIGMIPSWSCRMGMMLRKQKELFRDRFEKKGSSTAVARR